MVPLPDAIARHAARADAHDLVLAHRIDLTEEQTRLLDPQDLARGRVLVEPTPEQADALAHRHQRLARQLALRPLRPLRMAKAHKPKLLSAHFSVTLDRYRRVNGFDESFVGYGQEDDDLGARLMRSGARVCVAVADIPALHLHHETRAPGDFHDSPNAARLRRRRPVRCELGLESPAEQPTPTVRRFDAGAEADPTDPFYAVHHG